MARPSRLLALLAALALPSLLWAANEKWNDLLAEFRQNFVHKGEGSGLQSRKKAIGKLAASKDGRAVPELLAALKKQEKHIDRLRKEHAAEEAEWNKKDERLQGPYQKKLEMARERGETTISLNDEEAAWFGTSDKPGKRLPEKERISKMYMGVLDEEGLVEYILRSCARVANDLEGPEQEGAVAALAGAARGAKADDRAVYLKSLGYVKGDKATDILAQFAVDADATTAITAIEAIGRQNSERGIGLLKEQLKSPRWQIRAAAIEGLTFYRDVRVMDALLEAARAEDGVLQRNYFVAMARITREAVPATVEAWESFWKSNRTDFETKWKQYPIGEPVTDDPPPMAVETTTGSTSFYGITTNSKHIIFVIDISGSMADERVKDAQTGKFPIDVAQQEIKSAIRSMAAAESGDERGDATFNVVTFSSKPEVYKPGKMIRATKGEKEDALKWIDEKVKAFGQTNIHDALEQAFNIVSATSEAKNLKHAADTIYFMTDGHPTDGRFIDPELILREVKRWNQTRKITIHAIGVGKAASAGFLQRLAAENGGQYIER